MNEHPIVFFDGQCVMCNGTVRWLIRRDPNGHLRFASQQSEIGQTLLEKHDLTEAAKSTIILIDRGQIFTETTAFFKMVAYLKQPWNWLQIGRIVPRFVRDSVYRWVSRNRYRWFKPLDVCVLPAPEIRQRFVD